LVQGAPVPFLPHPSWQLDDVDEVGRGAKAMLDSDPDRHVWGLGRHYIGSNFFWYLRDPPGNLAEYHSDLDVIVDDEVWESTAIADERALYAWAPRTGQLPRPRRPRGADAVSRSAEDVDGRRRLTDLAWRHSPKLHSDEKKTFLTSV
jgi:hypothetical protein